MKGLLPLALSWLVAVAIFAATTNAQVVYPAMVVPVEGGGCPVDKDQQEALSLISRDVREILSNSTSGTYACAGTSGWSRIAFLNMIDPAEQCPSAWSEVLISGVTARACGGITIGDQLCDSNIFPNTDGLEYSQVCGKMIGYQFSAPDAFRPYRQGLVTTIDGPYMDGISLTHGAIGSRQHIWSFAAGEYVGSSTDAGCPCDIAANTTFVPPFVRDDYFCESGVQLPDCSQTYFSSYPLWDNMNCANETTCCNSHIAPYFMTTLPLATTDDLEVRLCSYDLGCPSDIAVSLIEIYVK